MYPLLAWFMAIPVERYIVAQRDRFHGGARTLSDAEIRRLCPYFGNPNLNCVRIAAIGSMLLPEPPFNGFIRRLGFDYPSVSLASAITFDNVIVCTEQISTPLLFHELVHVVQFRTLGVSRFSRQYVEGFLRTRSYNEIPIERCAAELANRFVSASTPFSVEAEVKNWIAHGWL